MSRNLSGEPCGEVLPIRTILVALVFLAGATEAFAQRDASDIPTVTRTYALEGARIVQAPGRVIEHGTVVIRDGLIVAVGVDVDIPYDAERIAADSMTVYAAFIDGLSMTGVPAPKRDEEPAQVDDPANPEDDRAGIQPQRDVRTMLKADDKSITALREVGFGAAHVVPHGRFLPGNSAIILLGGKSADEMVLRGDAAMFAQFQGARGVYPRTPMAMTAKMRQLIREARRRQVMENRYRANPSGLARPEYDDVHYAFFPIIDNTKSVFFFVDDALEIHRALKLSSDLGFDLMLAGLNEAFDTVDELVAADVPLFVTLNLPKKPKWMAKMKRDSIETVLASFNDETRTATYRDLEAEKRNLEARQLMSRDRYIGVARDLNEAGLTFGFSTLGVKPADIRGNIREIIERGLSETAALAALTTDAAELLGLSGALGSVDTGKIANLIVSDGPIFDEKTHIRYVFVDGHKFLYEKKEEKEDASEKEVTVAGEWLFTAFTPEGERSGTVTLKLEAGSYSGTMACEDGAATIELYSISFDGESLSFSWDDPDEGPMTVEGVVSADEFEGVALVGMDEMTVIGKRQSDPS